MTELTPEQQAARRDNGEFGTHENTGPELELGGNVYSDPATAATVRVILERWDYRDNAETIGTVEFDARAIFDNASLDKLASMDDTLETDWIFEEAREHGLTEGHDGPFTVELPEDFEDYLRHREDNGMVDPYPSAAELLALAKTEHAREKRAEALAEAERRLADAGTVAKKVSELTPGDVLVQNQHRLTVDDVTTSSAMPGFLMVQTDFGYLYLDPDLDIEIEAE
ncbi:hypothetical protein [Microbacterium sp. 77mftsu3.1]|uniref:hypothetical protein n=1 Tax=Microbacterium sp. 77mftsu3.1 TaxID=1761802 RepID=UPI00035FB6C9|nr:hypothetical protein [Microbacterium sp. 77mftsu3.1]SDH40087.1 hypothetical protein SAMN04488590_3244 [Microbacterium sp. 77mftsu3.1]